MAILKNRRGRVESQQIKRTTTRHGGLCATRAIVSTLGWCRHHRDNDWLIMQLLCALPATASSSITNTLDEADMGRLSSARGRHTQCIINVHIYSYYQAAAAILCVFMTRDVVWCYLLIIRNQYRDNGPRANANQLVARSKAQLMQANSDYPIFALHVRIHITKLNFLTPTSNMRKKILTMEGQ